MPRMTPGEVSTIFWGMDWVMGDPVEKKRSASWKDSAMGGILDAFQKALCAVSKKSKNYLNLSGIANAIQCYALLSRLSYLSKIVKNDTKLSTKI